MDTYIYEIKNTIKDDAEIEKAGQIIRNGGLVAFPTETVYGLGGDALNAQSSQKIYAAKGRPSDNPLIVHICRLDDIYDIVSEFPESAQKLAENYWPGPLTMVLPKSDKVPDETTGGLSTVAVRMPVDPIALSFIKAAGGYVAAPSANTSGKPSPTKAKYVIEDMDGKIDMIIDGGDVEIGLESTIVDLSGTVPMLLRPGFITLDMLRECLGEVRMDPTLFSGDYKEPPKAPGMKYRHYAPKGILTIVSGMEIAVVERINEFVETAVLEGKKVGVIATDETLPKYDCSCVKSVGTRKDEVSIAHNLYRILREFDDEDVELIYSEAFDTPNMGQAIMNRLLKAAGHHVMYVEK